MDETTLAGSDLGIFLAGAGGFATAAQVTGGRHRRPSEPGPARRRTATMAIAPSARGI